MMNAIMHRDYRSTGPTMFYQYADRIEILNSGGLYGRVNRDNFPDENDYRNPIIADAMRTLGYVNRFGRGIGRVKAELIDNGNGEPFFDTAQIGSFRVSVGLTKYAKEAGSAAFTVESSQKSAESTQTTAESDESRRKSNESVAESNETGDKSRESILSWASNVLPGTIRADARGNMIKILLEIGLDPKTTTEKMKSSVGISESGVHKILVSLKKMGLVSRVGADFGGHWELVGFEP